MHRAQGAGQGKRYELWGVRCAENGNGQQATGKKKTQRRKGIKAKRQKTIVTRKK